MQRSFKFLSLILAVLLLLCGSILIASAEGEDGGETGGEIGGDPVDTPEEPIDTPEEPVAPDTPVDTPEEPQIEDPGVVSGGVDETPDTSYTPEDNYYYYEEDPIFYGDASSYDYNTISDDSTAGSVSSQTTLYNTSGISAAEAAPNEWSEITLDEKTVKTGVADFSAIKSNTDTSDNGDWILYLGYVLLALSALGILYFIASTVAQRKADKAALERERRRSTQAPARSTVARLNEKEERERRRGSYEQRTSRFADEAPSYSRRVSAKADTGEIYVPRRAR